MRKTLIGLIGAIALPSTLVAGCADYSSSGGSGGTSSTNGGSASTGTGTGGTKTGTGGAAGTGGSAAPSCPAISPCGGDLVGTWNAATASSSCVNLSGQLDLTRLGAGSVAKPCTTANMTGGTVQVTGSITFNSDGTFTDSTVTTLSEQFLLPGGCREISSTPAVSCESVANNLTPLGYTTGSCTDASNGDCNCQGTLSAGTQIGGLGIMDTNALDSGNYTPAGNVFTTNGGRGDFTYQYCVSGSTLTLVPQTTKPTTTGTITFQKQ